MNKLKLFLFGAILLMTFGLNAQEDGMHRNRFHQRNQDGAALERLQESLGLSEEQVTALQPIFAETKTKMQALRAQDFDNPGDRRTAAQKIMETQQEAVKAILTEEQAAKMAKLHEERKERMPRFNRAEGQKRAPGRAQLNKTDRDALHQAVRTYHEENVRPVLAAQRAKLETELSTEDKATIDELRAQREKVHQHGPKLEKGARPNPPTEEQKALRKAHMETVKSLVEKYETAITPLMEAIHTDREKWRTDLKAIYQTYHKETTEDKGAGKQLHRKRAKHPSAQAGKKARTEGKHAARKRQGALLSKGQFLLMDPNGDNANITIEESPFELEAYPNPAISSARINYTVAKEGKVSIMLRNKAGNISQVLFNGFQQVGAHTLDVNISNLQAGTYFYTITDASGTKPVTKQLIITK